MDQELRNQIFRETVVPIWPTAGKALGFRTRSAAFAAARRGAIRTIPGMGRRHPVPTAWLKSVLLLSDDAEASPAETKAATAETMTR
jgi:hypothetical protein